MTEHSAPPASPPVTSLIRVSAPVRRRLEELAAERKRDLGRMVTMTEVLEQLLDSHTSSAQ